MSSKLYEKVAVDEVLESSCSDEGNHQKRVPWHPGLWARLPSLGLTSLLIFLAGAFGALAVLILSNGQSQQQWQRATTIHSRHFPDIYLECPPPSVLLAIINALANVCLLACAGSGFAIYWWRRALHGTSIKDLHQQWYFANSALAFICKPRFYGLAALAAIGTKISLADGVLLQKATAVVVGSDKFSSNVMLGARMAATYPATGFVTEGNVTGPTESWGLLSWSMEVGAYGPSTSANATYSGCDAGTCSFVVETLGFSVSCEETLNEVHNLSDAKAGDAHYATYGDFSMSWAGGEKDYTSIIYMTAGLSSDFAVEQLGADGHCYVRYTARTRELRPAILEYGNMTIANTSNAATAGVSLPPMGFTFANGQFAEGVTVKSYLPIREDGTQSLSTIGGFQYALQDAYAIGALMVYNATSGWSIDNWRMPQSSAQSFWTSDNALDKALQICFFDNDDPLPDIMLKLNQWTYMLSAWAVSVPADPFNWQFLQPLEYSPTHVAATKTGYGAQYVTSRAYTIAAVATMLACALLILPLYYGYWEVGRTVSLSPLEIAHALGAPMLESTEVDGGIDHLQKEFGGVRVQYGVVGRGPRLRLGMARPGIVQRSNAC